MTALQCATTLVVARHGEAEYEAPTWAEEGGSLTARGRKQAAGLAEELAGRRIAHVWTSDARPCRADRRDRGRPARDRCDHWIGLREFDVGDHRGVSLDEDPFVATYTRWLEGHLDERVPGGETGREIADRFDDVLREVADAHPGESVLVVSHGGAIGLGVPAIARMDAAASCSATATPSCCSPTPTAGSARGTAPIGANRLGSTHGCPAGAESWDWCAIPSATPSCRTRRSWRGSGSR